MQNNLVCFSLVNVFVFSKLAAFTLCNDYNNFGNNFCLKISFVLFRFSSRVININGLQRLNLFNQSKLNICQSSNLLLPSAQLLEV